MGTIRVNNRRRLVAALGIAAAAVVAWTEWAQWTTWTSTDGRVPIRATALSARVEENGATIRAEASASESSSRLTTATFDELLIQLRTVRKNGSVEDVDALLHAIARDRPALAIELARAIGENEEEISRWSFALVADWAARDPKAAWRWLGQQSYPEAAGNLALLGVVFDQMATWDSTRLVELAEARMLDHHSTFGFEPQIVAHACVDALINSGNAALAKDSVEAWVQNLEASRMGAAPLESIALYMAERSPADAAEWLKKLPESEARNFATGTLASDWASRDPRAALNWVRSLTIDEGRNEAMQRAYGEWVERDPASAAEWLDSNRSRISSGSQADSMLANLVAASPMVQSDGEGALLWSGLISAPNLRSEVIAGVFARWLRTDQAAAARQLNLNLELTSQQKDKIIRSFLESTF